MSYSHLSIIERKLETLFRLGWTTRDIGRELGRHHSTIAREIERGRSGQTYEARSATSLSLPQSIQCTCWQIYALSLQTS